MSFAEMYKQNQTLINESLNDIHTSWIGKIYDVDNKKRTASVKFLQKAVRTLKNDTFQVIPPDLTDVPLLPVFSSDNFEIYMPYSNNDKVLITVLERPYEEPFSNDEISEQQRFGKMDIAYSIVARAIPSNMSNGVQNNAENICISNKKNGTSVVLGNNIEITGNVKINGTLDVTDVITSDSDVKAGEKTLLTHTNGGNPVD